MQDISYSDCSLEEFLETLDPRDSCQNFQNFIIKVNDLLNKSLNSQEDLLFTSFNFGILIKLLTKFCVNIKSNIEYLQKEHIFSDDLSKVFSKIYFISSTYLNAFLKLSSQYIQKNYESDLISKIQNDINIFYSLLDIFSNIFGETINNISKSLDTKNDKKLQNLNLLLGIECSFFNFCVKVEESSNPPYFKSKFIQVYKFREEINQIKDEISLIKSFCCTGKKVCIPLFLLLRNLRDDNNSPFVIMMMQTPYHVWTQIKQFQKLLSKYIHFFNITCKSDELIQIFNDENNSKITLGILTSYNLIPLAHQLKNNVKFTGQTRFVLTDIYQKTFHNSVLVSQIIESKSQKKFNLPLNVILLSSFFPPEIENVFKGVASVISLSNHSQYTITEKQVLSTTKLDVKIQKSVKKAIYSMARLNQETENKSHEKVKHHNETVIKEEAECKEKTESKDETECKVESKDETECKEKVESKDETECKEKVESKDETECKEKVESNDETERKEKTESKDETERKEKVESKDETECKEKTEYQGKDKSKSQEKAVYRKSNSTKVEEGHILCFLPDTKVCNRIRNLMTFNTRYDIEKTPKRKIIILKTTYKPNEGVDDFILKVIAEYEEYKKKEEKEKCIFFLPLVVSGITDNAISSLARKKLPKGLEGVNKLIFGTQFIENLKIKDVSVVIDSGSFKDLVFNHSNGLTANVEKAASEASMNLRKGRLGRTMNGLYIKIQQKDKSEESSILERDITNNLLSMKMKNINFENLTNLPYKAKEENLEYSIDLLNKNTDILDKITDFDIDTLGLEFRIPFHYLVAIIRYSQSIEEEKERNYIYFITSYISMLIIMNNLLLKYEMSDKLENYHDENSDIVTLYKVFNKLVISRRDELLGLKNCFSNLDKLIDKLKKILKYLFPNEKFYHIFKEIISFADKKGIYDIIDEFLSFFDDEWKSIHSFNFQGIRYVKTDKNPQLIFLGDDKLKINNNQTQGKIFLTKRPGWKGLNIPSQIYCFNIDCQSENKKHTELIGHLIHGKLPCPQAICSIERNIPAALNPWFNILLDTYFEKKIKFYFTTLGGKVFLSFLNNQNYDINEIEKGVDKCIRLFPHTPRGVLVYQSNFDLVTQIRSVGANDYESIDSTRWFGAQLTKEIIDNFSEMQLYELSLAYPNVVICSLFVNETCKYNELDHDFLYIVSSNPFTQPATRILSVVQDRIKSMNYKREKAPKNKVKYGHFQFPPHFIHPSLVYHEETQKCLLKWFQNYCPFIEEVVIDNHKFRMKLTEIVALHDHLYKNKEKDIKEQMNLQYVAVPFPKMILKDVFIERERWYVNTRYNTIIAPNDDAKKVEEFISMNMKKYKDKTHRSKLKQNGVCPVWCIYGGCDQQELNECPYTIMLVNREVETQKICKNCIIEMLKIATDAFYSNGLVNYDRLGENNAKPISIMIPAVSKMYKDGKERFPLIPFGQFISVLFNFNDNELSSLVSAYLQSICDYTIRYKMKNVFTFCRLHPHTIYRIKDYKGKIHCKIDKCENSFCVLCHRMHSKDFNCRHLKLPNGNVYCPNCFTEIEKAGGCNIMDCRCGSCFCFECQRELTEAQSATHFLEHQKDRYNDRIEY